MVGSGKEPLQGSLFKVGFKVGCRGMKKRMYGRQIYFG